MIRFLIAVAIGMAIGRFFVPTHDLSPAGTYEAFAHLLVGGLLAGGLFGNWMAANRKMILALAAGLIAVEVFVFVATRSNG